MKIGPDRSVHFVCYFFVQMLVSRRGKYETWSDRFNRQNSGTLGQRVDITHKPGAILSHKWCPCNKGLDGIGSRWPSMQVGPIRATDMACLVHRSTLVATIQIDQVPHLQRHEPPPARLNVLAHCWLQTDKVVNYIRTRSQSPYRCNLSLGNVFRG